ncbi:MAG: elongation factor Ts [Deltaproteobacteria bacterium]|nr:elongation factor Ts [Deltaproteobacteria bacterium]
MQISASMVRELRDKTGAGMMDCKKALTESGNMENAVTFLREKGLAAAQKKAGRVASEGLVGLVVEGNKAGMVEVNCETDFVAKNEDFKKLVQDLAKRSLRVPDLIKDTESLINDKIATIGEKIALRRVEVLEGGDLYGSYLHAGGSIGCLVELKGALPEHQDLARDLAMHVAASAPVFLNREAVDTKTLEAERHILATQTREQGKPENMIERIVNGKIEKYYSEVCFLEQKFVKDPDKTIQKLLQEAGVTVIRFVRFKVGEGLEKKADDFAQEVAKMVG